MRRSTKVCFIGGLVVAGLFAIFDIPFNADCVITFLIALIFGAIIGVCAEAESK